MYQNYNLENVSAFPWCKKQSFDAQFMVNIEKVLYVNIAPESSEILSFNNYNQGENWEQENRFQIVNKSFILVVSQFLDDNILTHHFLLVCGEESWRAVAAGEWVNLLGK